MPLGYRERYLETTPDPRTGRLRSPNTIIGYLLSFKGVFRVAVNSILIDESPMDKVAVGGKIDSKRQSYSIVQVTLILNRAVTETDDIFLPLLVQAYTGCRVSEIVDCSTLDFNFVKNGDPEKVIPGKWFLFIDEDHREPGCTVKGHKDRYVPLHPEIVKRLIPYMERVVAQHGHGHCSATCGKTRRANGQPMSRGKSIAGWMGSSKIPISPRTIASGITLNRSYSTAMFPSGFPTRSRATRLRGSGANTSMWKWRRSSRLSANCR